ncbi:arylamine N-acetyltransferase [Iamia sp. SCSIO 61187]|uniref:arylamine N-acetyltransferase family protein n=1 Tax=Iamia sp. SCSIO 61187 TaxID=2722752 RepID=UPI001C62B7C1|nr:arylamine N-acetyltransferase [Iamia sp. SCSIO 61187]QYG93675.1 arylamine N-acetyltransferase [Iamia sp. SCSIO 61187]
MPAALPDDLVDAYLRRLGLDREPPSADGLARIHRAHVERIPWETAWIHEGRDWGIATTSSAARIATTRRGGYCFHLNGGFAALVAALGYHVTRHVGRVHGPDGPSADGPINHLALVVSDLPADDCPEGRWYVDVGLGDGLHSPTPLVVGPIEQPPFTMVLAAVTPEGVGEWHLAHDPAGSFTGMSFGGPPTGMDVFGERHTWLTTDPESNFVRYFVVKRRTADTEVALRGLNHSVVAADGTTTTIVDDRSSWLDLLAEEFGIEPQDPDRLWPRVLRAHQVWTAAQG